MNDVKVLANEFFSVVSVESLYSLLHKLTVPNRDNCKIFTDTQRLERIHDELKDSSFSYCHKGPLFHAYAQVPFDKLPDKIILISSHVDLEKSTKKCFSEEPDSETLKGTYDNSITNAAIVCLMKKANLPSNVVVAFTGDEECEGGGASEISDFINDELKREVKCIVLDVTESGNDEDAVFTIENDCWDKTWGRTILEWAKQSEMIWRYVPYDMLRLKDNLINELVDKEHCIGEEAGEDETTTYYEANDIGCFSLCIPVDVINQYGDMHSSEGLKVRKDAYKKYIKALYEIIWVINNG